MEWHPSLNEASLSNNIIFTRPVGERQDRSDRGMIYWYERAGPFVETESKRQDESVNAIRR